MVFAVLLVCACGCADIITCECDSKYVRAAMTVVHVWVIGMDRVKTAGCEGEAEV